MLILFLLLLIIYKILNKILLMNVMLKISNSNHDKNLFLNNKTALLYEFSNKIPIINNLIISLTSYPERIEFVHLAIKSLLNQAILPSKIILWLAESEFPNREKNLP